MALEINYFSVAGHQAFVLQPDNAGSSTPWVWYAPTRVGLTPNSATDWLFRNLLDRGIAIAGTDAGECYGSPAGRAVCNDFYTHAVDDACLASRVCLLAQSRGGLLLYNWAAENSEHVSGIAGIYTVCDLRSYPGLDAAAPAYGMTPQELHLQLSENNPIDRLVPLAQTGIDIFHIAGDSDAIVPLEDNSQVVHDRYTALGGQMTLVVIPGKGHEEIPPYFQSIELLNFLIAYATSHEETHVGQL